jgi:hypothetical protein
MPWPIEDIGGVGQFGLPDEPQVSATDFEA